MADASVSSYSTWESYKRMFGLAKPQAKVLIIGTIFLALGSGMGLAYPQAVRYMIDGALAEGIGSINRAAFWMTIIFLIGGIATGLRHYLFTLAGFRIVTDLQARTYRRIIEQEIAFFDQRKTGELLSRLSSDTTVLQNTVSVNISQLLRNLVATIGGIALLVFTAPRLALVILAVVPPVSLGAVWFGRKIRQMSKEVQDALARAGETAEETIAGMRTVRAFAREQGESDRYGQAMEDSFQAVKRRTTGISLFQAAISFAGYGAVALILWMGGRQVLAGTLSVGELSSFLLYTMIVAFSVASLGSLYADFMRATGAAERIFEILDREPAIPLSGGKTIDHPSGAVHFENVVFAYPSRPDVKALDGITLDIQPGEVVALVGPSGSGKSTLTQLVPRFYDPNQGSITLDGIDLTELDPSHLRRHIGIVPQEPILFSNSIEENIRYGVDHADHEAVAEAAALANAADFIQGFPEGYQTTVGERGIRLSGGQKQRIAIARAILKNPRLLILDEATSALDAESEHLVKQALERLMKGRTTLIVAHRLSTVKDADRVVVLDNGRIVEQGTHQELLGYENGLYRKLIERQFFTNETLAGSQG